MVDEQSADDQLREAYGMELERLVVGPVARSARPEELPAQLEVVRRLLLDGSVQVVMGGFDSPVPPDRIQALGGEAIIDMAVDLHLVDLRSPE